MNIFALFEMGSSAENPSQERIIKIKAGKFLNQIKYLGNEAVNSNINGLIFKEQHFQMQFAGLMT